MKQFLSTIALIVLMHCSLPAFPTSIEVSGDVSGVWNVDTVKVIGNINIREVESLYIQPGVKVIFQGDFLFNIKGRLLAVGLPEQYIYFTKADTTGFHNDTIPGGGWLGLRYDALNPAVDSSIFSYCWFEYGKAVHEDSLLKYGGAICIRDFSKVEISHCHFTHNKAMDKGGAIYLKNADILLMHNQFSNNTAGGSNQLWGYGGAVCTDYGEPIIMRNVFTGNSSTGVGGALAVRFSDCPVFFNTFEANQSAIGGAMGVLHVPECRHVISNNLIINNFGIFFGGAVSNNNSSPTWVNNTIAYNACASYGGAFYCKDSINPKVYNTIIWGNQAPVGSQVYLWDTYAQASFFHCNIQEGWEGFAGAGSGGAYMGEYINNIDADPMFEGGAQGLFGLTATSPCINSGMPDTTGLMIPETDLAGNQRMVGQAIDMGAYEYQFPINVADQPNFYDAVFYAPYPNPANGQVIFSFYLLQPSEVQLSLVNAAGQVIRTEQRGLLNSGKHDFTLQIDLAPGIYSCLLSVGTKSFERKLVFTR